MELTFLGTGSAMPTRQRNVAAVALRLPERGELWLFDCGEATQHRLMVTPLRPPQIRRVFVTHLHGDHLYGLPGLLTTMSMLGVERPVDVHGPPGLATFVEAALGVSQSWCSFPLRVHELQPQGSLEDGDLTVRWRPLEHNVPSFGFRVEERPRAGRFDPAGAAAAGVPPGPAYGVLKAGGDVTLPDGTVVRGRELTGPPLPGRTVVVCGDTRPCAATVELARDADLLVHEATFGEGRREMAAERGHSTAAEAAGVARRAGALRLLLTHFSARYQAGGAETVDDLLAEARAVFPATDAAHDLLTVEVPRRPAAAAAPAPA